MKEADERHDDYKRYRQIVKSFSIIGISKQEGSIDLRCNDNEVDNVVFGQRILDICNKMPEEVLEIDTITIFKKH